jgi:hypothetical protein
MVPTRAAGLVEIWDFEDGPLVYDPQRKKVHLLNSTAAFVYQQCNGVNSPASIARLAQAEYRLKKAPTSDIEKILKNMSKRGIVKLGGMHEKEG